ncbi:probable RNA-binding protein EIF1AD [Chiloscyllium plagiosum]|uniref:probable RNA-binding protein EIF1AD n=1 Tax=Chiloscyllium plagiosum TaxID=36176 RepID=UPI001CB88A42|nr:probable RNA-binding protein EIF1AD [Chiloscyllium plagiosum]
MCCRGDRNRERLVPHSVNDRLKFRILAFGPEVATVQGLGQASASCCCSVLRECLLCPSQVSVDFPPPPQVLGSPGNNLHEVETAQGDRFLASMPTKFRKNIWIKRGDFLIVDPIQEGEKVKAEINSILYKEHIKQLRKDGLW